MADAGIDDDAGRMPLGMARRAGSPRRRVHALSRLARRAASRGRTRPPRPARAVPRDAAPHAVTSIGPRPRCGRRPWSSCAAGCDRRGRSSCVTRSDLRRGLWQTPRRADEPVDSGPCHLHAPPDAHRQRARRQPARPRPRRSRRCSRCGRCGCSATGSSPSCSSCTSTRSGSMPLTIGIVLTLTLLGDTLVSLWLTTHADRLGRRRVLIVGVAPHGAGGSRLRAHRLGAAARSSPRRSGSSRRPATRSARSSPIEQAALSQTVPDQRRTATFAWYNLAGYVATATGALSAGLLSQAPARPGRGRRRCLPRDRRRLRRDRPADGGRLLALGAAVEAPPRERRSDDIRERARPAPIARGRRPAVGAVRARRVRRRASSRRA